MHKLKRKKGFNFLLVILLINALESFAVTNSDLDNLEDKIFHQKYINETNEERVSRLEGFLFGTKNLNESIENRLSKINNALQPQAALQLPFPSSRPEEPKIIYDESSRAGVVGAIGQIENKVFNKIFNDLPFQVRVANLEEKLLTREEIIQNRKKLLLERVTSLVQKAGITTGDQSAPINPYKNQNNELLKNKPHSYTIDPNTGFLINENTGKVIRDASGNPIVVMVPGPLPEQQNLPNYGFGVPGYGQNPYLPQGYGNPYGQGLPPGGLPFPTDLFNPGGNNNYGNEDPGY